MDISESLMAVDVYTKVGGGWGDGDGNGDVDVTVVFVVK